MPDITSNLDVYYHCNGDLIDSSVGGANFGAWVGTPAFTAGKWGQAINFTNGSPGNRVVIPPLGATTNVMTWAWWMKPTVGGGGGGQWVNDGAFHDAVSFAAYNVQGDIRFDFFDYWAGLYMGRFGLSDVLLPGDYNAAWPAGVWTHVAITYDKPNSEVKVYSNGAQVGATFSGPLDTIRNFGWNLGNWATANRWFNGAMDEVRIYRRVLTASDIARLATFDPTAPAGNAATVLFFLGALQGK